MLARLTADGGNMNEYKCPCRHCAGWATDKTGLLTAEVDWERFESVFDQNDADGSGSLDFLEFVALAEDRALSSAEEHDVKGLLAAKEKSKRKKSKSADDVLSCECFDCQYRRLIGTPPLKANESAADLRARKVSELYAKAAVSIKPVPFILKHSERYGL
jgi:hypothetical protein